MGDLRNVLSWSVRRAKLLEECPRKYWWQYYGGWGGWERSAPPEPRRAYLLKHLKSRHQWVGERVLEAIDRLFHALRDGREPDLEAEMDALVERMRSGYRESLKEAYVHNPKHILRLLEHEYAIAVDDAEWVELREHAKDCLRAFFESLYFDEARQLPAERWLALRPLESFDLDGVPVYAPLRFGYLREDGGATLVDFKTGRSDWGDDRRWKAHTVALRVHLTLGIALDRIRHITVFLADQEEEDTPISEAAVGETRARIVASMDTMRGLVRDGDVTHNAVEREACPLTEQTTRCPLCQYRGLCWPDGPPPRPAEPAPA